MKRENLISKIEKVKRGQLPVTYGKSSYVTYDSGIISGNSTSSKSMVSIEKYNSTLCNVSSHYKPISRLIIFENDK